MGNVQVGVREIWLTNPAMLLRFEGLVGLIVAVLLYREVGQSWVWFVVLFLGPDLSMVGYAAGNRIGAAAYNAAHTLVLPLIWLAHIAMDRALGYGLKLPTGFKDTHLG